MTRLRPAYAIALAMLSGALAACPPPPPADGGDTVGNDATDTSMPETSIPDGTAEGGPGDAQPDGDGGANTCNMIAIEDLNSLGMMMGDTVRYAGNNTMASTSTTAGIQIPTALRTTCNFSSSRQRVFRYTVRGNSVLRISTTNMGTDPGFDTTLAVINVPCPRTLAVMNFLGCNDDDPSFGADDRRVSSSLVTARQVMMGSNVYIAVGGFVSTPRTMDSMRREQGNFVLTVQELPVVADGMACDPRRLTNACGDTSTCVANMAGGDMGTCRANGTVAGARCDMTGACTGAGLSCQSNFCVSTVADGMPCDGFNQCGMTSTCVNQIRGVASGICRANGSAIGTRCATGNMCSGAGLSCRDVNGTPTCLFTAAADMACSTADSACPTGYSCVANNPTGLAGTCRATGSVLRAECAAPGTMCSAGAGTCTMASATLNLCLNPTTTGMACNNSTVCPMADTCYLLNTFDRVNGRCVAPGTRGGNCRGDGSCDAGLMCSNMMDPMNGRCVTMGTIGGACGDNLNPVQCPMDAACVRNPMTGMSTCQMRGSVAGAACNATAPACASGLTCSATVIEEGICQSTAAAGGMCSPWTAGIRCAGTEVCRASSLTAGTCAAPTAEMESNDGFMGAGMQRVTNNTTPNVFRGALGRFDVDCYPVDVPANGRVFAIASTPSGLCPGVGTDLALDLYRDNAGAPELLGVDNNSGAFGCPRIDGNEADPLASRNFEYARNLAAGRYYVCLRNLEPAATRNAVPSYIVSLSVSP